MHLPAQFPYATENRNQTSFCLTFCKTSPLTRKLILQIVLVLIVAQTAFAQLSIQSFAPVFVKPGDTVTISGNGFSPSPGENFVSFNHKNGLVVSASPTQVKAIVSSGTSAGPIMVSKSGFSATSGQFFYPNVVPGNLPVDNKMVTLAFERKFGGKVNYVQAADMDGDGMTDAVAAIENPGRIIIERNISTSDSIKFSDSLSLSLGPYAFIIEIAELNGDGKPDIVLISFRSNMVRIFRNNSTPGNLSFTEQPSITMNGEAYDLVIADFDNDGKQDIATGPGANGSTLEFFRNNSTVSSFSFSKVIFSTPAVPDMYYFSGADYDNDGKTDLIAGSNSTNSLYILRNTSNGPGNFSFTSTTMSLGFPAGIEAGTTDLNRDGRPDIVISTRWHAPKVFLNASTGTTIQFQPMNYTGNTNSQGFVSFTDLNTDGDPEIISGSFDVTQRPGIYENLYPDVPLFGSSLIVQRLFVNAVGADFNHDGKTDLLCSGYFGNNFYVLSSQSISLLISNFSPQRATTGTPVTIKGLGFTGITSVSFGNMNATSFQVDNDSTITAVVGNGASGNITVSGNGKTAFRPGFTFFTKPVLQSFSPASGYGGSEVLLNGTNMEEVRKVRFGGVPADTFFIISNTQVRAIVGKGASGEVTIAGSDWDSSQLGGFTFFPGPDITGLNSLKVPPGSEVVLTGNYFNPLQVVTIGGITAVPTSATPNSIRFNTPSQFIGGSITVKTAYGSDTLFGFYNGMQISGATPLTGKPGDTIRVMGNGFGSNPLNIAATIGTASAEVLDCTPEMVTLKIPSGPPMGAISLALNGHTVSGPAPFIFSFETTDSAFTHFSMQSFFPVEVLKTVNPEPFTIADIDQDGKQDLIQKDHEKIVIYRNTGQPGSFSFQEIIIPAIGVILTGKPIAQDLNMDGKPDLIFNSSSTNEVVHFINLSTPGHIAFKPYEKKYFNFSTFNLLLHDVDKDGRPDYVLNPSSHSSPAIFFNGSTPDSITFSYYWDFFIDEGNVKSTHLLDLDMDGKEEVIIQQENLYSNTPSFTMHTTPGKVIGKTTLTEGSSDCQSMPYLFADFNNDGKTDWLDFCNGAWFTVKRNTSAPGNISFSKTNFITGYSTWFKMGFVADFNGDMRPDFVILDEIAKILLVFINSTASNGEITFWLPIEFTLFDYPDGMEGNYQMEVADLDADHRPDIIVYGLQSEKVQIFRNLVGTHKPIFTCKDQPATLTSQLTGNSYQWQQSTNGNSFANLVNGSGFSGVQSPMLNIAAVTESMNGKFFRCLVNELPESPFSIRLFNRWVGTSNNLWSDAGNWSCGTVPQGDIEVEIDRNVMIDIDVTIGKIVLKPGGTVTVAAGKKLTVLH